MNGRFNKIFPKIADDNKQFENDILAEGRTKAEFYRRQRQKATEQTSKDLGELIGYTTKNPETGKDEFIRVNNGDQKKDKKDNS
ncbi:MAG TPA: hypothetical protein P5060_03605 [Candidatus Absconditabacterales bacterium]|nr:hypothetical protein [Candidatus Absconditabacterales bacterium]